MNVFSIDHRNKYDFCDFEFDFEQFMENFKSDLRVQKEILDTLLKFDTENPILNTNNPLFPER